MFRTFSRRFLPNRLDWILKRAAKKKARKVLLCWNRGLGDIPLGLAALTTRIFELLPEASITVLTRSNLEQGFSLLKGVTTLVDPEWKRGEPIDWKKSLQKLRVMDTFDLVLDNPKPSEWCTWQQGRFVPRLLWQPKDDSLVQSFPLSDEFFYLGVQVEAETSHGTWRNWPENYWHEFFDLVAKLGNVRVLLFGYGLGLTFPHPMVVDLRGKTTLLELLSIIKNRCSALVLPDSGILSFFYFLDVHCPIRVVSLWADWQGVRKQGVDSPNGGLTHIPLISNPKDLSSITPKMVLDAVFPKKIFVPLSVCKKAEEIRPLPPKVFEKCGCIILAGGQGTRLGVKGPKGLFPIMNKTLFQHLVEKVPPEMPIAIMTSPLNHAETVSYFERNDCFGKNMSFFPQEMVETLNENYVPVGLSPNGNGSLYRSIVAHGVLDQFEKAGIEMCSVVPIENMLASPADTKLLSFHLEMKADVTIQCVERVKKEKMGAIAEGPPISIVEYLSIEEDDPFLFSYTGQLVLSVPFIRKAVTLDLPYHWVRKKLGEWVWKRERFVFDAFSKADCIQALCFDRKLCYAPVKDLQDRDQIEKAMG